MQKVLVAGGTGYLGQHVIKELSKRGFWIRAFARSEEKLKNVEEYINEKFIGDITDINSLSGICKDIDIVFSSIGITKQKDGLTYLDVDYQGNKNILDEAKKENVSKFIYVSVFNAIKMKNLKAVVAKLKFEEELKISGLNYSIIYPNGFFSDMEEYLEMAKKGKGQLIGSGGFRINPIHGKDLADVCVNAIDSKAKEVKVGGPDILTHYEIFEIAFNALNKKVKISKTPIWLKDILVWILRTFTSVKTYGPFEFFMTVISMDMVAPVYGKHHLKNYFDEIVNKSNR